MGIEAAETLADLARKYKTDKGRFPIRRLSRRGIRTLAPKAYTDTYARFFGPLRNSPITLLEIGVDRGGSARLWESFFQHAAIHAIDISPHCKKYEEGRIKIHIGSQTDETFLASVAKTTGPLDIVIDDGGHTMEQHRVSLGCLWPHVKAGGFYAIEDLHTSYLPSFGGGGSGSTMKRLMDAVDGLHGMREGDPLFHDLEGVWFASSLALLVKKPEARFQAVARTSAVDHGESIAGVR
jgi:hypothetical protein